MHRWEVLFAFAFAFVNCNPVTFDLGKEYGYNYRADIHMKGVDDFQINAQVYFTNIGNDIQEQELKLEIDKFSMTCKSKRGVHPHEQEKDLSKWFSFEITDEGEIEQVYYDGDEHEDVLFIKKGVANLLSGKFLGTREAEHVDHDNGTWFYNTTENGHEGEHNASYHVEPTPNGKVYTKQRTHCKNIPSHAESSATKSVLIDHDLGTIHSVTSIEHVGMKHKTQPGFDPFHGMREVKPVSNFEDIDIPEMRVGSTSKLTFTGVRDTSAAPDRPANLVSMRINAHNEEKARLSGQRMPKQGENETSLLLNVEECLKCIKDQPETGSKDLLRCSADLVTTLLALPDDVVISITDHIFNTSVERSAEQVVYQEAILDSLFMIKTKLSQSLILKYSLSDHTFDRDLFRRSLFQLNSLEPVYEDIQHFVEGALDEGEDVLYKRYGSEDVHIMLLAFGSVSRKLMEVEESRHVALKFNNKIKDMLGIHDPHNYRMKRSLMTEKSALDFDWRKVVYLEALGNAQHPDSFEHIISHVNSSISPWIKRAAVHALRFYNRTEAANAIMIAATEDEHSEVRHESLLAYQTHPAAIKSLSKRAEGRFEKTETRELAHTRNKRGILDAAFEWSLEVPSADWRKTVGSTQLGAAFGVIMINNFDLKISPLSGHFKIEVHDEVYARATIGILGLNVDVFLARVCFKGGATYNLNLLQEFDPRLNEETVRLLTEGIRDVTRAIKTGIDTISQIIDGKISLKNIIEDFLQLFRSLPDIVSDIREAALKAIEDFGELLLENLPPFLEPMKQLIEFVSNLISDIKLDVMDYFYTLVQAVETIIPRAAKQIFKSVKGILKAFPELLKDPKKAVAKIGKGVVGIAISIGELKAVEKQIMNSSFVTGVKPYWMDIKSIFEKTKDLTIHAFKTLWSASSEWVEEITQADDPISELTGGKMSQQLLRKMIIDRVNGIVDRLLAPFERLKNIGDGSIWKIFNLIKDLKEGFDKAKTGYKAAIALIQKVFGPKFHTDFPKLIREGDSCAKNGFFPSNVAYEHNGVDLVVSEDAVIVAPLSGVIQRTRRDGEAKLIQTELPNGQELLIENVDLDADIYDPEVEKDEEKQVAAGDRIGTAKKSKCANHIHVVLRDKNGAVMDPSRLLAPRPPHLPEWKQLCNDKRVVIMDNTVVAEPFVKGMDNEDTSENLPDDGERPQSVDDSQEPTVSGNELYGAVSQTKRRKRSFKDTAANLLDVLVTKTKTFLARYSIRKIKLGDAAQLLQNLGMTQTLQKIGDILVTIKGAIEDTPCIAPSQMTDDVLETELINRGLTVEGNRNEMVKRLTNPDTRCPYIAIAMRKSLNMHCIYSDNCLGLQCCMSIDILGIIHKTSRAFFRIDIETSVLHLGFEKWSKQVPFSVSQPSTKGTYDTGIKFSLIDDNVHVLCKYSMETSQHNLTLTFGCGICSLDNQDRCVGFVTIIDDAVFQIPHIKADGTVEIPNVDLGSYFDRESIKEQLEDAGDIIVHEGQEKLKDRIKEALGVTHDLMETNSRCLIPANMENSELIEELTKRGLSVNGTRGEKESRITTSDTVCKTNTDLEVHFPAVNEIFRDRFKYSVSKLCMRIDACLDIYLPIIEVTKTVKAAIEIDPCNYKIHLEFEKFKKSIWLIDYPWGKQSEFKFTDKLFLTYTVNKTDEDFILSIELVCRVIDFQVKIVDNQRIPIPVCNEDFKLPGAGDLISFAESMHGRLTQGAFDVFAQTVGIHEILQNTDRCTLPANTSNCDVKPADFIPPLLKDILQCKMLDNCWGVSCCLEFGFDIPFSDTRMNVSIPFIFKYDPCQYFVEMSVGKEYRITRWFVEYEWGKVNRLTIGKGSVSPIKILYTVDKFETGFTVDVQMAICLPNSSTEKLCIPNNVTLHLLQNEHIPTCNLAIDSNLEGTFPNFSLTDWLTERRRNITTTLGEAGREYILETLNLEDIMLQKSCNRTRYPYSPSTEGWNIECKTSHRPVIRLPDSVTCHVSSNCKTISCCTDVPQIHLSVKLDVEVDLCQNKILAGLENVNNQMESALSDYKWGENRTIVLAKVFKLSYNIIKPATNDYVLNVGFRACFERNGDKCLIDTQLITGLEIPRIYCRNSENIDEHLANTTHQCAMDADLQGITCNVAIDEDIVRDVYFRVDTCLDRYIYTVDDMRWNSTLSSLPQDMDNKQELGNDLSFIYSVSESGTSFNVDISFENCQTTNGTYSCDSLPVLSGFPLYKTNCTTFKRRRRRSEDEVNTKSDLLATLKSLYSSKASSDEINAVLNALKLKEEKFREDALRSVSVEDSDSKTKASSLMKSMGKGNPMTMLYTNENSGWDVEVVGGQLIADMLSDTAVALGKGAQSFVVGSGLTEQGVRILGKQIANMTVGNLVAFLELNRVDPKVIHQLTMDLVDLAKALYADTISVITSGNFKNAFESFDIKLRGKFDLPRGTANLYTAPPMYFLIGPVLITFEFGVDQYLGMEIGAGVGVMSMVAEVSVTPYTGLSVWGVARLYCFLYAELRLTGDIMEIRFPTFAELDFSKFPIDVGLKMDLVMVPLRLSLDGLVTLSIKIPFCCRIKKVLYKATIWRSKSSKISKNIINNLKEETDASPPEFNPLSAEEQKRDLRSSDGCKVRQLPGYDYTEPEFELMLAAQDDKSQVKFFLDVGTYPGGFDTLKEFQLGGALTRLSKTLKHTGVPLFFTVHAQNSQGLRASVSCELNAFDVTEPTGRAKAEFLSSSNPHVLTALITVHDESPLIETNAAIGFGEEMHGDQIVPWHEVKMDEVSYDPVAVNDPEEILKHFSGMIDGKLVGGVLYIRTNVFRVSDCAMWCLSFKDHSCLSINYDFGETGTCEILKAIEGHDHILVKDALFAHYERRGTGQSVEIKRTDLNLPHNTLNKINLFINNSLEYSNVISSKGVLIDVFLPEPGLINNQKSHTLEREPCLTLIPDNRQDLKRYCIGLEHTTPNHRVIVDGPNSGTVFNGMHPLHDEKFTRINNYISANWNGFHDNETSIRVYAWTFGKGYCDDLIHPHNDPHSHLSSPTHWTHKAQKYPIPHPYTILPDGSYYITVRALNGVEYGGPLAVTVCHTTPYVVDTSHPFVHEIFGIRYDEKSYFIYADIDIGDPHSGISEYDVCLGKTSRDCDLLAWYRYDLAKQPKVSHRFQIQDGTPTWLRIRAVNNVQLTTVRAADQPIVVDESAPFPGFVNDGSLYRTDLVFSKDSNMICANWEGFYDPESGISEYLVGVGSAVGKTDILQLKQISYKEHFACLKVPDYKSLVHGSTYYTLVYAINGGIVKRNTSAVSNGVTIDLSPPEPGEIVDGTSDAFEDLKYSSSASSVSVQWRNFRDPESDIYDYHVQISNISSNEVNIVKDWTKFDSGVDKAVWKNFHLKHKDFIEAELQVTNGATNKITRKTDGFLVDLTAPILNYIHDGNSSIRDIQFQNVATELSVTFDIQDDESGLGSFKFQIFERYNGNRKRIWPVGKSWHLENETSIKTFQATDLKLITGAKYTFMIASQNKAGIASTHETNGVIVDITPPSVRWFHVGVFYGEEENEHDGYVYQADHSGIKLSYLAFDHQSGITDIFIKIGTSKGSDNIMTATSYKTNERDLYIDGLHLTDTDLQTLTHVYHVTLQVRNGAGHTSDEVNSTPIGVVPEDVPGNVVDGIVDGIEQSGDIFDWDIDYTVDDTTMSITFNGFKSTLHGIKYFVWAVGSSPGREDSLPFTKRGLTFTVELDNTDNSYVYSGTAHLPVTLLHGKLYYVTIRGITYNGQTLQSMTDGIMIDKTPPSVTIDRILDHDIEGTQSVYYESGVTSMSASFQFKDVEVISNNVVDNIEMVAVKLGAYPGGSNIQPVSYWLTPGTDVGELSDMNITTLGSPNFLSVIVVNKAGQRSSVVSPGLVVDDTPPEQGQVSCSKFAQPNTPIHCQWSGFADKESPITLYDFYLESSAGDEDKFTAVTLQPSSKEYFINSYDVQAVHGDTFYATLVAHNSIDETVASFSNLIFVDTTPPSPGVVVEVAHEHVFESGKSRNLDVACDTDNECLNLDITCQKSLTSVSVSWSPFEDPESSIQSYHVALGTTDISADIVEFVELDQPISERNYTFRGLNLIGISKIYVKIMAVNGAGLSVVSTSNGVFISLKSQGLNPLSMVGIWDADPGTVGDIDYQVDSSVMHAEWDTSGEPCPAVHYEWAIVRLDGEMIQEYTDQQGSTSGYNDQLDMQNAETYYSLLRVTNADGYVYVLRSDGVTIHNQPLVPGSVYDGDVFGIDLNVVSSKEQVTCNWDGFGIVRNENHEDSIAGNTGTDQEVPDNQKISMYEVALGTDRRFSNTRTNIVPFTNVGNRTSYTFGGLDLVPGTSKYYCTVKAYSTSFSTAQSMSNGFFVTFNGGVTAGQIEIAEYTDSLTTIDVPWLGFESKEDMMMYYVAVSSHFWPTISDCKQYIDGGNITDDEKNDLFDVYTVTSAGSNTYVRLQDLSVLQGQTYSVFVMGVDFAGECNMTVANTTIDVTKPEMGAVTGGPYFDMALSYTSDSSAIQVNWSGYTDDVSGIKSYTVSLFYGMSCEDDEIHGQIGEEYTLDENIHSFTFSDIVLETKRPYYVKLHVTNGAGLFLVDITEPILLDLSSPSAGRVAEGGTYTDDVVWWGSTTDFTGTILHYPNPDGKACPSQTIPFDDNSWSPLQVEALLDIDGTAWNIVYRSEAITINNQSAVLRIKMSRDSKSENVLSGGYWRTADLKSKGSYQISLKAASAEDTDDAEDTENTDDVEDTDDAEDTKNTDDVEDTDDTEDAGDATIITEMLFVDDAIDRTISTYFYKEEVDWSNEDCSCCYAIDLSLCTCSNCSAFLNSMNGDENINENQSMQKKTRMCGLQIYTGHEPFGILWYQFDDPKEPTMEVKVALPSDVADRFYTYELLFQTSKEDSTSTTCLIAFIGDSELGSVCGIPPLSSSTNFLIHVWNRDRFLPHRDDPLFTWNAYAEVERVIFPPAIGELCRYGDPFRGGDIPIVRYEAAIGSAPGLSDIHPFEEVYTPCMPCTDTCSKYDCDDDCNMSEMSQLVLTLGGLNLQSLTQKENVSELIVNYLTVKAVLGSGLFAISSSNGFYVDTTPPVPDDQALLYIDVDQGDYTPVSYQGSVSTIKGIWLCNDDESEIKEYFWAIGSDVGLEDIQSMTSTGQNSTGINNSLEGILTDKSKYFITIICENEAGLKARLNDTKGVEVLLTAPDPDTVGGDIVGAEKFDYDINPPDALKTDDPTSVGASWEVSEDKSIYAYHFCLGSSNKTREDILKCVWVGHNASGEVKIENGSLLYNGNIMYNLNELKYDSSASSTGGSFNMEPGRVIFVSIRIANEANKYAFKPIGTVTIVSSEATYAGVSNGKSAISLTATSDSNQNRKKRAVPIALNLITPSDLPQGETVMLVSLTEDDLSTEYTSSPSTEFAPYIVNPNITLGQVERYLLGRIKEFEMSFSVVTVGQFELPGPMEITFTQSNTNPKPGENIHMLIHWNTADQEWKSTGLTCQFESDRETQDDVNSTTSVKVCNTRTYGNDTDIYFKEATQFAVVLAKADVVNNAPYLESTTNLTFNEDQVGGYTYQLIANDTEGDQTGFVLVDSIHGSFVENMTLSLNGSISFHICAHCYGTFNLEVQIYDIPQSAEVQSNSTNVIIDINVMSVNDPPNIFLVDDNKVYLLHNDITEELQIFRDNILGGAAHFTAIVGAYEYDTGDEQEVLQSATAQGEFSVETLDSIYTSVVNCNESLCLGKVPEMSPSLMKWMFARVTYKKANNFTGIDTIKIAFRDSTGTLSDILTVSIYNLEFPCLNGGFCSAKTQIPCDDPTRLNDFDANYSCVCPIGWTDIHCGTDVDECVTSPCSTPTVCHNNPGSFTCDFPLYFIIPLSIGILVVIILVILVLFRNRIFRSVFKNPKGKTNETDSNFGSQIIMRLLSRDPSVHPETNINTYAETRMPRKSLNKDDNDDFIHPRPGPSIATANRKFDARQLPSDKHIDMKQATPYFVAREASSLSTAGVNINVQPMTERKKDVQRSEEFQNSNDVSTVQIAMMDHATGRAITPLEYGKTVPKLSRRLPKLGQLKQGNQLSMHDLEIIVKPVIHKMKTDNVEDV